MFNLNDLAAAIETKHEVIHPVNGPTGWILTLAGDDHPATKAVVRKMLDRRSRRKHSSPDQDEQDGMELMTARTLGWEFTKTSTVTPFDYSEAKAREIYGMEGMSWLRRQVLEAMGDETGFFEK